MNLNKKKEIVSRKVKDLSSPIFFSKMDNDKDGKLSKPEIVGPPSENDFDKIDTNKDGYITEAEFKKVRPPPPKKVI